MKDQTKEENQEINKNANIIMKMEGEEMEIGDVYLDGLEGACSDKILDHIPPQQVSLLEKVIIKPKNMKFLGITSESLKDLDGKKNGIKEKTWKAQ